MDILLPVLLPCPLCSAQQQLSAQTAAIHLWKNERAKSRRKSNRQSPSLKDLSNIATKKIKDGIYRAEPYFIENVGEVEVCQPSKGHFFPHGRSMEQRSRTLPILKRRNVSTDRYTEFLKLCEIYFQVLMIIFGNFRGINI